MPYSSSIQLVNDANGTAYAFLADNGSVWQCQWDSQAQLWAKAQQVPQAFGGEKLQALYLNNLWPTAAPNSDNPDFSPGIVLAYRVGEGSSAEVFASIGVWGSDGQLSWNVPVQLTDDQLDDHDFSLVAAESTTGGFSLVVQKQEASTPASTVREQLRVASSEEQSTNLAKSATKTLGADRRDSDLYTTSFNLGFSDSEPGAIVLTTGMPAVAVSEPILVAPTDSPAPAAPQPFSGNIQLSRQQIRGAVAQTPGADTATTSLMATDSNEATSDTQNASSSSSQNTTGKWYKGLKFSGSSGATQWRAGILGASNLTRWEIQNVKGHSSHNDTGNSAGTIAKASSQAINGGPGEKKRHWQVRWEGSFGIRNIGAGVTSESTALLTGGLGTDDEHSNANRARSFITSGEGGSDTTWYLGIGGLLNTRYFYDSSSTNKNLTRSPSQTLEQIIAHESLGIDGMVRYRLIEPGGNSFKAVISDYVGYLLSEEVENENNIPAWLADVGYYSGMVGNIEKSTKAVLGIGKLLGKRGLFGSNIQNFIGGNSQAPSPADRAANEENGGIGDYYYTNIANAIYGSLISVFSPVALATLKAKDDIDLGFGTGWQNELEITLRMLYHSIAGVEVQVSDSIEIFDAKTLIETGSSDNWSNIFYIAAGAALPHGGFLPLISDYIQEGSEESEPEATQQTNSGDLGSSNPTQADQTGQDNPLIYAPSAASNIYTPPSSNTSSQQLAGQPIGTQTTPLLLISLANSDTPPVTLLNSGQDLNDGEYENVSILGVTLSGTVESAAQASFTIASGKIQANTFRITRSGNYLALPEVSSADSSTSYALLLDVFSTGIAKAPTLESLAENQHSNPFSNLPLITLAAGVNSPLSTASIQSIQLIPVDPASQPSDIIYPIYNPKEGTTQSPSATNNSSYIYSNVGVILTYTPPGQNGTNETIQEIPLLNPSVTATVSISGGIIQRVDLSQPILFAGASGASSGYSVQLNLPGAVQSALPTDAAPTFNVSSQSLAVNNFTEEEQFSAQAGGVATGVYLSAGLSDQVPLYGSMGSWPVQNRVTYLAPSKSNASGHEIIYLNGFTKVGSNDLEQLASIDSAALTINEIYSNPNIIFSAASSPTTAKIPNAGPTTIVAWVEASSPVVPISNPDDRSASFQSYMQSVYGSQRINFRIHSDTSDTSWAAPDIGSLYKNDGWTIDNLHAFNVADPFNPGQELTWIAWSETSIDAIQGVVENFGSSADASNPVQAVIKAGWINPSATSLTGSQLTWDALFSDDAGNSTIQEIPWNPQAHVGLGISDISIASVPQIQTDGSFVFTPTISWSQDVRTPYKESVLKDEPYLFLDFAQLQSGGNSINIGSLQSSSNTQTIASDTGLNFSIIGALPKSQATAVQNIDGSGTLSTGLGSNNRMVGQILRNVPANDQEDAANKIKMFTGSINESTLTIISLSQGTPQVGDVITGAGISANTTITDLGNFDATTGTGTLSISVNHAESVDAGTLIATPDIGVSSFTGSISGNTLTVSDVMQGSLHIGDLISGPGIADGTTITAITKAFEPNSSGVYEINTSQNIPSSTNLVATPGIPTAAYTIEFWVQLQAASNPDGAGIVALGQPSSEAIGAAALPEGWLMSSSFVVNQITYNEAAGLGLIETIPSTVSEPGTEVYGWGWAVVAQGANTSAMNGNGGENLYTNSLILNNLASGDQIQGILQFLTAYDVDTELIGLNNSGAETIVTVPSTQLQFNNLSLNAIAFDTSSSVLNEGFVEQSDASSNLSDMFNELWNFQLKTGEAKVNFSLDPSSTSSTNQSTAPGALTSENYAGYALDFALARGTAISVNGNGQLVFDFSPGSSGWITSPTDYRDGEWHYIAASYLPTYHTYTIDGSTVELPISGTASLYIDNVLVDSKENVVGAYLPGNINDQAVLLANNAGGAIDQLAIYDKALSATAFSEKTPGSWPQPSAADVRSILASAGYGIPNQTSGLDLVPGAVTSHWLAHTVNPNDAALATYYSIFQAAGSNSDSGSWSEARTINPQLESQSTSASFSKSGSIQDALVIQVPISSWTGDNWRVGKDSSYFFNPANEILTGISVTITNKNGNESYTTLSLKPDQVLIGNQSLETLQPFSSDSNLNYTVLSNEPAFSLLIPKDQLPASSNPLKDEYTVLYSFEFTSGPNGEETILTTPQEATLNMQGSNLASIQSGGYVSSTALGKLQSANKAIATAAVIEQAPLQLKYVDSGEIFKSASSTAAANSPSVSSPASSFGQSQVIGNYLTTAANTYAGWLAIAQPLSTNAVSDPAGRIWIQYTGEYTQSKNSAGSLVTTPSSDPAQAPSTWLNALANSNFSPDTPNLPLLGNSNNPNSGGGLLIQADPTAGWGQNFGQTLLVADINGDKLDELIIGAPQANGGGRVIIISGEWISTNLTLTDSGSGILNLANISAMADDVTILTPADPLDPTIDDASVAGFGSALAYDSSTKTLWIGAPNYLQSTSSEDNNSQGSWQPVGAVYQYQSTSTQPELQPKALGTLGSTTVTGPTGSPLTSYWGSQLGTAIAVNGNGAIAISAPGIQASLLYSGTEVVQKKSQGQNHVSNPYGDGALIKIQLPSTSNNNNVSSTQGTSNGNLLDIGDQNKKDANNYSNKETTYMQSLRELQVNNIAPATVLNNQAIQTGTIGAVYFFQNSSDINSQSAPVTVSADFAALANSGGATFYGAQPWNTLGSSGFGSSLAFSDLTNSNSNNILAVGASQTGGSGAVYFLDTSLSFTNQPSATPSGWIPAINLGTAINNESDTYALNQYLAHLASSFTLYGAASGDQFGNGLVNLGDVNNDTIDDLLIQAYNASSGAGNGYVLFGNEHLNSSSSTSHNPGVSGVGVGINGLVTRADSTTFITPILSELGQGMSGNTGQGTFGPGDVNGDGLNDIALGSGPNGSAYLTWGQAYLAAINNLQLSKLTSDTGYMLDGLATTQQGSLVSIGDFNGDGYGDFITTQSGEESTTGLTTVRIELGGNTAAILADYAYNYYSFTVANGTEVLAAGDMNGDGFDDIALFLDQNLSSTDQGNQGAGSTTGILYGRDSQNLPLGSGFGFLAPVGNDGQPATSLPGGDISNGLTDVAPAVINVGNTIYTVVKGNVAGDSSLWFNQSLDGGSTWSDWSNITNTHTDLASDISPSLAFFNNKLYLAYLNTDNTPALCISSWDPASNNPAAWSAPTQISDGSSSSFSSSFSPQLVDRGDALGLIWVNADGELVSAASSSPANNTTLGALGAPTPWTVVDGGSSPAIPALARDGNTVYMAVQGNGDTNIYWTMSTDTGVNWADWQPLPESMTTASAPSLAVVDGTLYLSYLGDGNNEINITTLTDASTNSWSSQYQIPGQSATYASLISETIPQPNGSGSTTQLAVYYVSNDSTDRILKAYSSTPSSSFGWTSDIQVEYGNGSGVQTASGPLALTTFNGQTYIAYQGGTTTSPSDLIYLTSSSSGSTTNTGSAWSAQGSFNANVATGLGLTTSPDGLILSYGNASQTTDLQLRELSLDQATGTWSITDRYSDALPSTLSNEVAILGLSSDTSSALLLAGINSKSNGYSIQTSLLSSTDTDPSWSTPNELLERVDTNGTITFQPINASAAPSFTWLGQQGVLAVNDGGTIQVFTPAANSISWEQASYFTGASTGPVLATTDTGLALTYGDSNNNIHLERIDFVDTQGNPPSGDLAWISTTLSTSNGGLSSALATVPLSIDGNLLLANVRTGTQDNQIWLNPLPNLGNPDSTTWLNSTVQLPDGDGGWSISQQTGTVNIGTVSPTWTDDVGGLSPSAPTFAELNGVLYAAVVGDNTSTDSNNGLLYWNSSTDGGQTWSAWQQVPNYASNQAPSLAAFDGNIYMGYVGTNAGVFIASLTNAATNSWTQVQVENQWCQYLALTSENGELATYYVGTNDDDDDNRLYRTATSNPTSGSGWSNSLAIEYSGGTQTASGNLAVTTVPGSGSNNDTTFIAYQGGTSSSPSNTLYLTHSSTQSNGSSSSWSEAVISAQPATANRGGVTLSHNSAGLLLGYPDKVNDELVYVVQQSTNSGSSWTPFTTLAAPTGSTLPSSGTNNSFSLLASANSNAVLVGAINNASGANNAINTSIVSELPPSTSLSSSQTRSNLSAVGDLNGDGFADLLVTANNVVVNPNTTSPTLATGLRLISGAATSSQIQEINSNTVDSTTQNVQLAPWQGLSNSTPVASLSGSGQLTITSTDSLSGRSQSNSATLSSPTAFTALEGDLATAQQLFQANATFSLGQPTTGSPLGDLALISASGFGDLNGDGYVDYLDPTAATVVTGANGQSWTLWSIRAAGDVNGNGVDDVLLSLAPQGPAYVPASDGSPTALQSVLLDGALFKIDTGSTTFNLNNLRDPLDPYNRGEIYNISSTSNNQYTPLLQNWFDPILNFEPGSLQSSSTSNIVNPAGAESYSPPSVAISPQNKAYILFSGANNFFSTNNDGSHNSGLWMAYEQDGIWSQMAIATGNNASSYSPSAAFYNGNLYVTYSDVSGNIWIACTTGGSPENATWGQYQVKTTVDESTASSPTLIAENGRLALYFPSNNSGTNQQNIRYLYNRDPASNSGWGGTLNTSTNQYSGESGQMAIDGTIQIATSPIAATTFQGRTVLAFRSWNSSDTGLANGEIILATQVYTEKTGSAPSPSSGWTIFNTSHSNVNGVGLATDQALLYLTSSGRFGIEEPSSNLWSLSPSGKNSWSSPVNTSVGGDPLLNNPYTNDKPGGEYYGVIVPFVQNGELKAAWTNSSNDIQISSFDTSVSAPTQPSLAGYSLDGNIDVNGDGFTDILISDPSDPSEGVDNQYVLFGGDYLNIASKVGTPGSDVLNGTPLADVIYTLDGNDVVQSNGGADVIYTGSGNDQISIAGNSFIRIDGGSGFDALLLEGEAGQDYNFSLNVDSPDYFAGTKLKDIELINSLNYGSNTISIDAAAVNAINPDRILFLTPDASDFIILSSEFQRNSAFDVNFDALLWNAYAAGQQDSPISDNPALVYVLNPQGAASTDWLDNVSIESSSSTSSLVVASTALFEAPSAQAPIPTSSAVHQTQSFGSGLTLTSYRSTTPSDGQARFSISSTDTSQPRAVLYASSSLNSSAQPGRHYTAVAGLAILPKGQSSLDITVPINSEAFSQLRNGTLSLQVEEIPYREQQPLHLLIAPAVPAEAEDTLPPVISGLSISADPNAGTATLSLRADTTDDSADALNLTIARRISADASSTIAVVEPSISDASAAAASFSTSNALLEIDQSTLSNDQVEPSITDASAASFSTNDALVGFDQDNLSNDQVELQIQLNIEPNPNDAYVSLLDHNGTALPLDELGRAAAAASPPTDSSTSSGEPVNPPAPPVNPALGEISIQPTDDDGDGLREVVWAADGYGVDGNRDGVLDAEQSQVAGISLINNGTAYSDYGALAVSGDVALRGVALLPTASDGTVAVTLADGSTVNAPLPSGITNSFTGALSFTLSGLTPGGTAEALIYLPVGYQGNGNAYIRYNYATGRFEDYRDAEGNPLYTFTDTDGDGFGDAITLTLVDGDAQWDGDGLANGAVVDPGFLASGAIEIMGDRRNNHLTGNILSNQLRGRGNRDVLMGDLGDDILRGGQGRDRLNGGEGADILIGGGDADRFLYRTLNESTVEHSDTLQFGRRDQIDLRRLDANANRTGNQAFNFIANAEFSGKAGELRLFESRLLADVDGDSNADFALNLRSNQAFSADVLML